MERARDLSDDYKDGKLPAGKVNSPEGEAFRKATRNWATGVIVVTVPSPEGPYEMHGMSASSFNVLSASPRLLAVNVENNTNCFRYLNASDTFGINMLNNTQLEYAWYFANRLKKKLSPKYTWKSGAPILDNMLTWFALRKWAQYPGGDHTIFVGQVIEFSRTDDPPLVCCRGRFHDLGQRFYYAHPDHEMPGSIPGPLA